tara:strand:+ start:533 stop:1804 length:1272 start_codon:yes stop_codon:yes gene_type:complete
MNNSSEIASDEDVTKLLTKNINLLTQYSLYGYSYIYEENKGLKKEVERLEECNRNLRKRKYEAEDKLNLAEENINNLEKIIKKKEKDTNPKTESKCRKIKKYRKNKDTYGDDKIKNILINIKTIDDIINLEHNWKNIRHNIPLQKIYNLIPPLKKLQKMVGLSNVKEDVMKKIIYYIQNPNNDEYLHTIISGPPGVGKTEFAKIYAEIFQELGILKNSSFIEVKRDQLVGEYLGQTAPRTRKVLESAMGGVIFIDEAYSLGNSEKRDSFSKEAIDMINQYLSEFKNDFMMIVAGYDEELNKCFFSYNPGLRRRFSTKFNIRGYDNKELQEIFYSKLAKLNFINKMSEKYLKNFFKENCKNFKYFGGDIEKLVDELKYVQANRLFYSGKTNKEVIDDDLNKAYSNFKINCDFKKDTQPPFGMYV